jgi:hypothetical protein
MENENIEKGNKPVSIVLLSKAKFRELLLISFDKGKLEGSEKKVRAWIKKLLEK